MSEHRPVQEEGLPGQGTWLICAEDNQDWPCDHELQLRQEPPDREEPDAESSEPVEALGQGEPASHLPGSPGVRGAPADPEEER